MYGMLGRSASGATDGMDVSGLEPWGCRASKGDTISVSSDYIWRDEIGSETPSTAEPGPRVHTQLARPLVARERTTLVSNAPVSMVKRTPCHKRSSIHVRH